jgi:fructokinase
MGTRNDVTAMAYRGLYGRPVVIGDAVVGEFPNGARVVGGSALNVAVHLRELGYDPLLITKVGADADGDRVLAALRASDVGLSGVQTDSETPTGRAVVQIRDGQPVVEIRGPQAHEQIDPAVAAASVTAVGGELLVHSTVLARTDASWDALQRLRAAVALPVFLDLDVGRPWCRDEIIRSSLLGTRWLKVADTDLDAVCSALRIEPTSSAVETARLILGRCALDTVLVMRADGAVAVGHGEKASVSTTNGRPVTDAGRVGDAMTAGAVSGVLRGLSIADVARESLDATQALFGEARIDLGEGVRELEVVSV